MLMSMQQKCIFLNQQIFIEHLLCTVLGHKDTVYKTDKNPCFHCEFGQGSDTSLLCCGREREPVIFLGSEAGKGAHGTEGCSCCSIPGKKEHRPGRRPRWRDEERGQDGEHLGKDVLGTRIGLLKEGEGP